MTLIETDLPGVVLLQPKVFGDARGFFMETYNQQVFQQLTGVAEPFVQDNHSRSSRGILRGLHYQIQNTQGKMVRAVRGEVWDVAVDLRRSSPHFGRSTGFLLSEQNQHVAWVPPGLRTASWCYPKRRMSFTKPPTSMHRPMSGSCCGTIRH